MRRLGRLVEGVAGVLVRVETTEPVVAITFDDGPDPVATPLVLDALRRHGATATFFMHGPAAAAHQDIVRRVVADGHIIGCHGCSHRSAAHDRRMGHFGAQVREIVTARRQIGVRTRLYRPPYGHESRWTRAAALVTGHRMVGWSAGVADWDARRSDGLPARLAEALQPGAIVLLHDGLQTARDPNDFDRTSMVDALEVTLAATTGIRFVSVTDLLRDRPAVVRLRRWRPPPLPPLAAAPIT